MKKIIFLLAFFIPSIVYGQSNFGFEDGTNHWVIVNNSNNCSFSLDTIVRFEGEKSLFISPQRNANIAIGTMVNLLNFKGELQITCMLKQMDVSSIEPELYLQISSKDIRRGTVKKELSLNGWEKYTLSLNIENITQAAIGLTYNGVENLWVDDFCIKIDGVNIKDIKFSALNKIKRDKEFDSSSKVGNIKIISKNLDKLYDLCKIWGLLKYYHPNVGKGNFNWDYELFRIIPLILESDVDFNKIILKWIDQIDKIETDYATSQDYSILNNSIFEWVTEKKYGKDLYDRLIRIICSTKREMNCYVSFIGTTNPIFENENAYENIESDDCGYRLLALFRAWNIIEYFFPYKYLTDKNWDVILKEYIPLFINSQEKNEYEKNLFKFSSELCDSHSHIKGVSDFYVKIGLNFKKKLPILVNYIEDKCVITNVTNGTNFQVGDIITHIDGVKVENIAKQLSNYFSFSNSNSKHNIYNYITYFNPKDSVKINCNRNGKSIKFYAKYYDSSTLNAPQRITKSYDIIDENIGYINIGYINKDSIDSLMMMFNKNTKGLIIDLRIYPKDFVIYSLGRHLMPKVTDFVKFKQTTIKTPGIFDIEAMQQIGISNSDYYKEKIVLLVDNNTISNGEFTAMGFSVAPQCTTIGTQTVGADGNVTSFAIPCGYSMSFTGLGIYYPDGGETQRVGVRIDEIVKPTIKGVHEGRDELLERAIKIINSK